MMHVDLSTINREVLDKLPVYKGAYRIDSHMGNGCFLDPPGYPSYFTSSIWTRYGDYPSTGPYMSILGKVFATDKTTDKEREELLEKLYIKLPIDHPRVQEWIKHLYQHFQKCYIDDSLGPQAMHADKVIIWPVPYYQLKSFSLPYKNRKAYQYSRNLRIKRRDAIDQENNILIEKYRKICIPENHDAYRHIKRIYPDAKAEDYFDYIKTPPKAYMWYERLPKKPSPDECPGEDFKHHPVNGSWCQVCGWHK